MLQINWFKKKNRWRGEDWVGKRFGRSTSLVSAKGSKNWGKSIKIPLNKYQMTWHNLLCGLSMEWSGEKMHQMPCWHRIIMLNFALGNKTTVLTKHMLLCALLCEVPGCCLHVFAGGGGGGLFGWWTHTIYTESCVWGSAPHVSVTFSERAGRVLPRGVELKGGLKGNRMAWPVSKQMTLTFFTRCFGLRGINGTAQMSWRRSKSTFASVSVPLTLIVEDVNTVDFPPGVGEGEWTHSSKNCSLKISKDFLLVWA